MRTQSLPIFSQHQVLARTIYPDTPRIWSAYLYILGDVDDKNHGKYANTLSLWDRRY